MEKQTSLTPDKTRSEMLLQTTLQEHTSQLDLNAAWAAVAERLPMENRGQHRESIASTPLALKSTLPRSTHKKLSRNMRLIALVATLVIVLGTLTAASFSFGWWDPLFGNPNLYATINQQQVHQGVTVEITKVYADEGRTIIAYDAFSNDSTKQYIPNSIDLVGSVPQKQETLSVTYGESGRHFYMVQPPFLVPANVNALTITLNIGNVLVIQTGKGATSTLMGPWHFVFIVPFHHENNTHIAAPIDGDVFHK